MVNSTWFCYGTQHITFTSLESPVQQSSACLLNQSGFFRIRLDRRGSTGDDGTWVFIRLGRGGFQCVTSIGLWSGLKWSGTVWSGLDVWERWWFVCLNQLMRVVVVFLFLIANFDFVTTGISLTHINTRGPCLLSWKLHTHRFSCTQWGKWFGLTIVIDFCLSFRQFRACLSSVVSKRGCNRAALVGRSVLHRWPRNLCAGLVSIPSVGVLRQSRSALISDWPDSAHLVKSLFTVLTAFSALPLDCR